MKNTMILIAAAILAASCAKTGLEEDPSPEIWNGYGKYLKAGEQVHTLWAGKNINIGTVTYGIDGDANFYVTYDCSSSGWLISETHMYAGTRSAMPLNKPGAPKIGLFPYAGYHYPKVGLFTYRVPLSQLPPCESPGFVVAAHAVVHGPNGRQETAWAEGSYSFSDKGWGWYDDYYFNSAVFESIIIYAITQSNDSLNLYHLDVINQDADLMLSEYVGNAPGSYNGAAYDDESGMFFFVNYNTGELWVNDLQEDGASFCAGILDGNAASGTFYDGAYYYVDEDSHTIHRVTFSGTWAISGETVLDTLPGLTGIYDIAMSPGGEFLYMTGQFENGQTGLMTWAVDGGAFYAMDVAIEEGSQIAFGSDGQLYAVAPADAGGGSAVFVVDVNDCTMVEIADDEIIIVGEEFSDISTGPGA
jgi:hypothetical protein